MKDPYFENFIDLVRRMRQAQDDYTHHRHIETFKLSTSLEKQVDQFIHKHTTTDLYDERLCLSNIATKGRT